jgi:mannose-6-phosphate isomerase-like protein (cupin superfamily)
VSTSSIPSSIPPDDPRRALALARLDNDRALTHLAVAGGVYTVLINGEQTAGRYCLIEMLVPPGGGPPPHRHDFEEMFSILDGEIELTFRGEKVIAKSGETVNIPANAPHSFRNTSNGPARLLCVCTPPGQEDFFREVGDPVATRTLPLPRLTPEQQLARKQRVALLAPKYRTEILS